MARFGVRSEAQISRWVKAYREGGAKALRPKPKARPRGSGSRAAPMTREEELERDLEAYIHHWNNTRRQVKLRGMTPVEFREQALREAA